MERGLAAPSPSPSASSPTRSASATSARRSPEIIDGLREPVDEALDWLFDQAMALGQAALDALVGEGGQGAAVDPLVNETLTGATAGHRLTVDDEKPAT